MSAPPRYDLSVFVNCPFDATYRRHFVAIIFTIFDCGFVARCALEFDDGSEVRLDKIYRLIQQCRFGVHDLSRTELDRASRLPRFNMPFELGIFLAAKQFGGRNHRTKSALILDKERYRYQKFISDIAGQDIRSHGGEVDGTVGPIRDWLSIASLQPTIPGPAHIRKRLAKFSRELPRMCSVPKKTENELTFTDLTHIVSEWLMVNASGAMPRSR